MKLHRFNEEGLRRFGQYLDSLAVDTRLLPPIGLLDDRAYAVLVLPGIEIESRQFANRMEVAKYLDQTLSGTTGADVQRDVGLWAWLTLFYFDQVCPQRSTGDRKVGAQRATWIPQIDESRRFYRHAFLGPYLAYRAHRDSPDRARVLLADPLHVTTSEPFRLFIETPFINMDAPVELATRFFFNPETRKLRRGTGTKGPGGMRRLLGVLQQLDLTFDIHTLSVKQLQGLLPKEFEKWVIQSSANGGNA